MRSQASALDAALSRIGGLTRTSKMPCYSYSLPRAACHRGSALRCMPGTVCSKCYAARGYYVCSQVSQAQARRLASLSDPDWAKYMIEVLNRIGITLFRWHDSGDIQSAQHFHDILSIARALPDTQFMLPTHEIWGPYPGQVESVPGILRPEQIDRASIPSNIVIRVSADIIDVPIQVSTESLAEANVVTNPRSEWVCPATRDHAPCGMCRVCWSSVKRVDYVKH